MLTMAVGGMTPVAEHGKRLSSHTKTYILKTNIKLEVVEGSIGPNFAMGVGVQAPT